MFIFFGRIGIDFLGWRVVGCFRVLVGRDRIIVSSFKCFFCFILEGLFNGRWGGRGL